MAKFRISFDSDPDKEGPWANRKSARIKMIQSITDYLSGRCGAHNVSLKEVIDTPVAVAPPVTRKKVSSRK